MDILKVVGLGLIALVIVIFIRQYRHDFALLVGLGVSAVLLMFILGSVFPSFTALKDLLLSSGIETSSIVLLFKALGICFITQFAADTCKDYGQNALALKVETAGKAGLVILCVPMIKTVVETVLGLIE